VQKRHARTLLFYHVQTCVLCISGLLKHHVMTPIWLAVCCLPDMSLASVPSCSAG